MSRRHRRRSRSRNFKTGGRSWYRIPAQGHLAGVCAGLADYYQVSTLMARGLTITGALFMPSVVPIAYIVMIFALPTRTEARSKSEARERSLMEDIEARERDSRHRAQHFAGGQGASKYSEDAVGERAQVHEDSAATLDRKRIVIRRFKQRMESVEGRLQGLERHVTSRRYELAREIDKL